MIEWVALPTIVVVGVMIIGLGVLLVARLERRWFARLVAKAEQRPRPAGGPAFGVLPIAGPEAVVLMTHSFWSDVPPDQIANFRQYVQESMEGLGGFRFAWATPRPREVMERMGLLLAEHLRQRGIEPPFEAAAAYRLALQTGLLAASAMAEAYEQERVPGGGK